MVVGLGTGDVMLDAGPSSPLKKGTAPYFSAHVKMPNDRKVDLGPGHTVLDGDPAPPPEKGAEPSLHFLPIFAVVKRLDGSRYHLLRR